MRYGQIVCVRNWTKPVWRVRIFVAAQEYSNSTIYLCKMAGEDDDAVTAWTECRPIHDIEPRAFLEDE